MDVVDEYNHEKMTLPVLGIILMAVGLVGYIVFLILEWIMKIIPAGSGLSWGVLIAVVLIFATGAAFIEAAKKKKQGSRTLVRVGEVLSWGLIIVVVIGVVLRFFIH